MNNSSGQQPSRRVLVIDVGGSHVKFLASGERESRKFESGPTMTPGMMVEGVTEAAADWAYGVIAMGYPGPVVANRPVSEPHNLGPGWVGYDFGAAFGKPVRIINDAAMQALGSYEGGRMLFLGLGTGLGSAMVVNGQLIPMELAHLPYRKGKTFEDYLGQRGLDRMGKAKWERHVFKVVKQLRGALEPTDVVLGGGNVKKLEELPEGVRRGSNKKAFEGGFRLWDRDVAGALERPFDVGKFPHGVKLI